MSENRKLLEEELKRIPQLWKSGSQLGVDEVLYLYDAAIRLKAKTILEFGTGNGHSTRALAFAARELNGHVYTFDNHDQAYRINYDVLPKKFEELGLSSFVAFYVGNDLDFMKSWDKKIDLLFIDSAHTYQQTKQELSIALPLLSPGGEIIFHDVLYPAHWSDINHAVLEFLAYMFFHTRYKDNPRLYAFEILPVGTLAMGGLGRLYECKYDKMEGWERMPDKERDELYK